jgi:alkylation response protein AidB-like acyl-CoA dehydrogenase
MQARSRLTDVQPDPLATARSLATLIATEAASGDRGRTLTRPVVDALTAAGLFELMVPRELGGVEADALTTLAVFEELSRADGSTGWSFLANVTTTAFAAAYTGDAAVKEMFGGARPAIHAGMLGPRGEAAQVDGGYRVKGRYSFGSGCAHAGWIGAGTLVTRDGAFVPAASGLPEMRVVFVPRDHVEFLDNWDVLGLSGTGSFDYELPEQLVDEAFTFPLTAEVARRGGPVYRLGVLALTSVGHCGFALGVGRRALEEVARISATKQRMGATAPIRDQQMFQHDFAFQDAAMRAARAYAFEVFGAAQAAVERGDALSAEQLHRVRQTTTYATRVAAESVRFAYTWAGTDALRPSPLQRCFRDIHAATQHIFVDTSTLTNAAPVLLATYE